jgi:hypothetical protein
MHSHRQYRNGLLAVLAMSISIWGMLQPAQAAEGIDYNSSRSNKSNAIAAPGGGGEEVQQLLSAAQQKTLELSGQLEQVRAMLLEAQSLSTELSSLSEQISSAQAAAAESSQEELALLDEATRIFSEQIASLLEPELAQQVSSSLENRKRVSASSSLSSSRMEETEAALVELESMISELVAAADAAQKKGGNVEFEWKVEEGES